MEERLEPVGPGGGILAHKTRDALDAFVREPWRTQKSIAEEYDIQPAQFSRVINANKQYIYEESNRLYAEARSLAQLKMINLARDGNYKACEFILRTNGIVPSEKTIIESNNVTIEIKGDMADGE